MHELTTQPRTAVRVDALRKVFSQSRLRKQAQLVTAVEDVSFALEHGRSLGIAGESGSGKSTLARMIVGIENPTAGWIDIAGHRRPSGKLSTAERRLWARRAQIVFQDPYTTLDRRQSVGSCIEEVIKLHSSTGKPERLAAAAELLDRVGLSHQSRTMLPRDLSGGQRQRVAIARALAAEPEVLICDEAVSALDVSVQAKILNVLCDLRSAGDMSLIFITHDLGVARQVTDDLIVMHSGRIVERGATSAVLDDPQDPYTKNLRSYVPRKGWSPTRVSRQ